MATVVGLMAIIGLRLLGAFPTIPYTSLSKLIPLIWIAVVLTLYTGWQYYVDGKKVAIRAS